MELPTEPNDDVAAIARISAVPMILRVVSQTTGLRFCAIARVTPTDWMACAVYDELGFGLQPGGHLEVSTTLCAKVRDSRDTVVMDHASQDPEYCGHITPKMYGFESYISVPIFLEDGSFFGTVCALDPNPLPINQPKIIEQVKLFAQLIALQLDMEEKSRVTLAAKQRVSSFVLDAPAALAVLVGPSLTYELANERYRRLVGDADLVGLPARDHVPHLSRTDIASLLEHVYATGERSAASADEVLVGDEQRFLDWVAQPSRTFAGAIDGVLFFAVDVTAEVHSRDALERKNAELDRFAYVASHDLKSPLRGIGNLAQWVEEDAGTTINAQAREHLGMIRQRVGQMNDLVDGILRYARAGDREKALEDVATAEVVGTIVTLLDAPASTTIDVASDLPTLRTSRVALQQVFLNLMSNAIQHSRRVDPRVAIEWKDDGARVAFAVRDNGPGIAPQHQERVWKLFQSLEPATGASGIGLSIVRKLVEARGGKVWIESSPGEGATFHFTWPKHESRTQD